MGNTTFHNVLLIIEAILSGYAPKDVLLAFMLNRWDSCKTTEDKIAFPLNKEKTKREII